MSSLGWYLLLVGLVAVERLNELRLSRRNAALAFARGGIESGRGHYRVMTALHTLFLVSCVAEPLLLPRPFHLVIGLSAVAVVLLAQGLRAWAIASLGDSWNTRVITVPGVRPVTRGPYRHLRHPNYLAVIAEVAALPLVHGAWWTALGFSLANLVLLAVRIRVEEQSLGAGWQQAFAGVPRFVPGGRRD